MLGWRESESRGNILSTGLGASEWVSKRDAGLRLGAFCRVLRLLVQRVLY